MSAAPGIADPTSRRKNEHGDGGPFGGAGDPLDSGAAVGTDNVPLLVDLLRSVEAVIARGYPATVVVATIPPEADYVNAWQQRLPHRNVADACPGPWCG